MNKKRVKVLKFIPVDWLSFRKSKNFSTIENTIFPNIKTFYGAIYSAYYRKKPSKMRIEEIESMLKEKYLNLIGPFIVSSKNEIFLKTPSNLKYVLVKGEYKYFKGYPIDYHFKVDDFKLRYIKYGVAENLSNEGINFISLSDFEKFRRSKSKKLDLNLHEYNSNLPFKLDKKVGIALNNQRIVDKDRGAFYVLGFYRFDTNAGFGVFIDEKTEKFLIDNKIDYVTLGSKGKIAKLEIFEVETDIFTINSSTQIKGLVLLTPAIFRNGFLPKKAKELGIIAACNFKPEVYGTWDLKSSKPGKLFRTVPTGSVYFTNMNNIEFSNLTEYFEEYNYGKFVVMENCEEGGRENGK